MAEIGINWDDIWDDDVWDSVWEDSSSTPDETPPTPVGTVGDDDDNTPALIRIIKRRRSS